MVDYRHFHIYQQKDDSIASFYVTVTKIYKYIKLAIPLSKNTKIRGMRISPSIVEVTMITYLSSLICSQLSSDRMFENKRMDVTNKYIYVLPKQNTHKSNNNNNNIQRDTITKSTR